MSVTKESNCTGIVSGIKPNEIRVSTFTMGEVKLDPKNNFGIKKELAIGDTVAVNVIFGQTSWKVV